jgi:nucleoid-associated protein YgaU
MARNKNRKKVTSRRTGYGSPNEMRGVPYIRHYVTPIMTKITPKQRSSLTKVRHIWKTGDRFYKLAARHYGDPTLWWVLAWYNGTPTESHVKKGWTIYIPFPVERVLSYVAIF